MKTGALLVALGAAAAAAGSSFARDRQADGVRAYADGTILVDSSLYEDDTISAQDVSFADETIIVDGIEYHPA